MKEYKILKAKNAKEAERLMNEMSEQGWEVVTMTYWNAWTIHLLITFRR